MGDNRKLYNKWHGNAYEDQKLKIEKEIKI
jgi:hypothetical protein